MLVLLFICLFGQVFFFLALPAVGLCWDDWGSGPVGTGAHGWKDEGGSGEEAVDWRPGRRILWHHCGGMWVAADHVTPRVTRIPPTGLLYWPIAPLFNKT